MAKMCSFERDLQPFSRRHHFQGVICHTSGSREFRLTRTEPHAMKRYLLLIVFVMLNRDVNATWVAGVQNLSENEIKEYPASEKAGNFSFTVSISPERHYSPLMADRGTCSPRQTSDGWKALVVIKGNAKTIAKDPVGKEKKDKKKKKKGKKKKKARKKAKMKAKKKAKHKAHLKAKKKRKKAKAKKKKAKQKKKTKKQKQRAKKKKQRAKEKGKKTKKN
jgi:hypothetical protein